MKLGHPESVRLASNHIQLMTVNYSMEHRAGIEPANTGFADQRVSHFATGAHLVSLIPEFTYFACAARSFFARYQVSTVNPAPPPFVRLRASSTVAGAGTMTR